MARFNLGKRIAPPRFILFAAVLVAAFMLAEPRFGWSRAAMGAFDLAALVTMIAWTSLLKRGTAEQMRRASEANDANRAVLLGLTGLIMVVILVAVAKELQGKNDAAAIVLVVTTLVLTWLFTNTVYALHYAHLYYSERDEDGSDARGLDLPHCDEPDYWDFIYFSFTLGMTFQTSDVTITSRRLRRIVTGHCLAAFVFNLGILAFTINSLGGSSGGGG
jgi:uncharacterized membrane protein